MKKAIALKWLGLYYSFCFVFSIYFISQLAFTISLLYFTKIQTHKYKSLGFSKLKIKLDKVTSQWIWEFWEFYTSIILSSILSLILIYLFSKFFSKNPINYLGFRAIEKRDWRWLLYFILLLGLSEIIIHILGTDFSMDLSEAGKYRFLAFLGFCIFGPIFEETLFRGFIFSRMNELLSTKYHWITIVVTSILFSSIHFQYNLLQMSIIFVMSLFLGFTRYKTQSLWLPIIFHILNNSLAFCLMN